MSFLKHLYLIIYFCFYNLNFTFSQENWSVVLPNIGTFSSPRVADLNGDGVKDIIMGAGRLEFQHCDSAIIALDGRDGKLLWKNSARDQIFGSPTLYDINKDGIDDIFITGRSSEFKALDGISGKTIWSFDSTFYSKNRTKRWFNFYNPQLINDLDSDGIRDILVSNGGDIWVKPFDINRAPGRIVIMSSASGKILAEVEMPDKKEIYMSVVIKIDGKNFENSKIIFGTGGETVPGNLYVGTIGMVLKADLSAAIKLAVGPAKGFIAPPAWVDITGDGIEDIVANSVDGRVLTFDGVNFKPIWEVKIPGTEAYSSMAIGQFNTDKTPDFFVSFAQGVWPDLSWTKQAMINGKNGVVEFTDSLGYYQTSSPVAADLNEDGIDEAILNVDYQILDSLGRKTFYNMLYAFDFTNKEAVPIINGEPGHNVSVTPWIGDLDNDGFLDIVYSHGTNKYQTYTFDGLKVNCLKTKIPISKPIKWGSYMGSKYDGMYR